jgi:Lon protease-like protein
MTTLTLPLFPLNTVLFPQGPLPLRIFETRYLDMVSQCLQTNSGFGVCLIKQGKEVGGSAITVDIGVVAKIVDWHQRHDGLLGISTVGEQRFKLNSVSLGANRLAMAEVNLLPLDSAIELPDDYLHLVDMLRRLIESTGHHYANLPKRYADAAWVANRLVELLPIEMSHKQLFLEMDDPILKLQQLAEMLEGKQVV